jgi:hypothetical protein
MTAAFLPASKGYFATTARIGSSTCKVASFKTKFFFPK